ncbi:hypothetical protein CJ030_MR4G010965 [Morella rubra]|uniref:Uncharacterized protein n=1 Tax=Morella rubra TaxID=262757 RepID=A0A6A1VSD5_9ROSI|nr:hypothetical protein CJ030_MR4G010965 [Morella rubra]
MGEVPSRLRAGVEEAFLLLELGGQNPPAADGGGLHRDPSTEKGSGDDFELNYDRQEDRETVNSIMNAAFKNHKAKLYKHFKKFGSKDEALQHRPVDTSVENWIACCELFSQPSYQERSRINTNNRAKLKVHHTGGSRPFVWHRKKLQDPEVGTPTAADLYSKTHNKKKW